jgi:hypothetical protein
MTFGMKSPFSYSDLDEDTVKEVVNKYPGKIVIAKRDIDPISMHQGPGHEIIDGPLIRKADGNYCEPYKMCKKCCKEVIDATLVIFSDDDDDNGAVMF